MTESIDKQISNSIDELRLLYIDSKKSSSISTKIENYNKATIMINNTKSMIDTFKGEIQSIRAEDFDSTQIEDVEKLVSLVRIPQMNFDELVYIFKKLKAIGENIPTTATITDNIDDQVIYVEQAIGD